MGPQRKLDESPSVFRLRYARYCFVWLLVLGLPLAVLLLAAPRVNESSMPLVLMFLYVGLPMGVGLALLAAVAFTVGSLWAAYLERNASAERAWPKLRLTVGAIVLLPVAAFALYLFAKGLLSLEVPMFARRNNLPVTWGAEPGMFLFSLFAWGATGIGLSLYGLRRLRKAYAS